MAAHCQLTQDDGLTVSLSVAFGCVLSALICGEAMDASISDKLMGLVHDGVLPFGSVTARGNLPPGSDGDGVFRRFPGGQFPSPDGVLLPGYLRGSGAHDPAIRIEPAWKVCGLYSLPCAIYGPLPAAYYLAARFAGDFESAVLHAINGGGQNLNRASLTGALAGAQVGLSGIPAAVHRRTRRRRRVSGVGAAGGSGFRIVGRALRLPQDGVTTQCLSD